MKKPMVSAVMLNYNSKYFPKMCVEAFRRGKMDFDYEIIAVDNNSSDPISLGYLEKAAEEGLIEYVKLPKNLGYGGGNNAGAKKAKGNM